MGLRTTKEEYYDCLTGIVGIVDAVVDGAHCASNLRLASDHVIF